MKNKSIFQLLIIVCFGTPTLTAQAQVSITVDSSTIVASGVSEKYGMNLNAGIDSDLNRELGATTLANALVKTGAKHLRYPGGKKSLYYSWSSAPFTDPSSHYWVPGWYADNAQNTMDFDEFIGIANQIGAQAHINVAYNPENGLGEALAAAWVNYANVTNNYAVKYWEIGNEMWKDELNFTASSLCDVTSSYSVAMKAVDPDIRIGVSWDADQVQTLINACQGVIDFVTISDYSTYNGSYSAYADGNHVNLIAVDEGASKKIVVSEFAPTTWQGDADDLANTAGKGIINFDQIGQYLLSPNTEYANFWNTHWYDLSGSMFDAMDNANNLLPVAQPMALWAQFIKDDLVQISSDEGDIVPYAAFDKASGDLNLLLVNKSNRTHSTNIVINSPYSYEATASATRFQGTGAWDKNPTLSRVKEVDLSNGSITTSLPHTSITAISLIALEPAVQTPESENRVAETGKSSGALGVWQLYFVIFVILMRWLLQYKVTTLSRRDNSVGL